MTVQNMYTLRELLKTMRETYHMSWREIGLEEVFGGVSFGTLNAIYKGREPGKKARKKLGMPDTTVIEILGDGEIPPGSQAIKADQCACGQWFISNSPRRKKCFKCSPYRKHAHSIAG